MCRKIRRKPRDGYPFFFPPRSGHNTRRVINNTRAEDTDAGMPTYNNNVTTKRPSPIIINITAFDGRRNDIFIVAVFASRVTPDVHTPYVYTGIIRMIVVIHYVVFRYNNILRRVNYVRRWWRRRRRLWRRRRLRRPRALWQRRGVEGQCYRVKRELYTTPPPPSPLHLNIPPLLLPV